MSELPMNIYFPGKLVIGSHSLPGLNQEILASPGKKILLVTIEPLLGQLSPLLEELRKAGRELLIDTSILQEPSFEDVDRLMQVAGPFDPDWILGIGGGSVLDMAKILAALIGNEQRLEDIVGIGLLKGRTKKLVCVPATSGTGSEVSPNSILLDREQQKKGIISPFLVPDIVYVDPVLTISVPASITAATGLDALTHCMEAFTNKFAQPFIDIYAYKGMELIAANLVKAVQDGSDQYAREQVAMGSLLGGFCLGPVNTAAVHALSYPLGSKFHLPHGLSNALLLPYVMSYNIPAAVTKYAAVARALGCATKDSDQETAMAAVEKVRELIRDCGIPATLRDMEIPQSSIPEMAKEAMQIQRLLKNNPREVTEEDAIEIYQAAYG